MGTGRALLAGAIRPRRPARSIIRRDSSTDIQGGLMTIELRMLAWTLVLAFIQILLFDFARTGQYGLGWNTGPRDETMPPLSPVAGRLKRAQYNLFETLPLFIGAVLIAHLAGRDSAL